MARDLLEDSGDEDDISLKVNKDFADRYEIKKRNEELTQCKFQSLLPFYLLS